MATKAKAKSSTTVAERLEALENLQKIDSEIDRILTIRGELPLEVEDLEADIEGLEKRVEKLTGELKDIETDISNRKNEQKDAQAAILAYKEKQNNVRNNREFESLSKEIEYQELEIQLHDKRSKEAKFTIESKKEVIKEVEDRLTGRKKDLKAKKAELENIIAETEKEEEKLNKKSEKAMKQLDDHLRAAYARLRTSAKNGLAVVPVDRDSCGGCFNRIPPQRQLDIVQKKKIIICEHCGRILIPGEEAEAVED
ncbi:MAG TPA: C4-type zinc ribbon domain-containing protein [Brumimicrobium sp.]|nr:C4-type zinc ribbon domain-containing protein [Brumimicrobium sp.]